MKRNTLPILFLGLCIVAFGIVRAEAQNSGDTRIGVVDLQRTLKETNAGKSAKRKLEADKKQKQKALDLKQKALQEKAANLSKQQAVLKPAVLRKRQMELQKEYAELEQTFLKLQQELAAMEAKLVQDIFRKASPVIQKIAKAKNLTMVIEKNEGAVLFAIPAIDITDQVNKQIK
jgi:outer membrane protein